MKSQKARAAVLAVAVLGFIVGIAVSLRAQPDLLSNIQIWPVLAVLLLTVPFNLLFNGVEFQLSVRLLGKDLSLADALETTIVGSAANMLPLPGSAMVRVARYKTLGVAYKHGISTTLFLAAIWLGAAAVYAGGWLIYQSSQLWGNVLFVGGVFILLFSLAGAYRLYSSTKLWSQILAVRMALVFIDACALYLCFWALDFGTTFAQSSVLTISGFLGAAVSIVPAGLGVREAAAAGLGELVAVAASAAYLASSLYRILGLIMIIPPAIFLVRRSYRQQGVASDT